MKHILITTIAAVVWGGCGKPEADLAMLDVSRDGNIEVPLEKSGFSKMKIYNQRLIRMVYIFCADNACEPT